MPVPDGGSPPAVPFTPSPRQHCCWTGPTASARAAPILLCWRMPSVPRSAGSLLFRFRHSGTTGPSSIMTRIRSWTALKMSKAWPKMPAALRMPGRYLKTKTPAKTGERFTTLSRTPWQLRDDRTGYRTAPLEIRGFFRGFFAKKPSGTAFAPFAKRIQHGRTQVTALRSNDSAPRGGVDSNSSVTVGAKPFLRPHSGS